IVIIVIVVIVVIITATIVIIVIVVIITAIGEGVLDTDDGEQNAIWQSGTALAGALAAGCDDGEKQN
ncbi:MAG: hypothetical protein ACE5LB_08555, partial [Acidiferrobacterales bacterium]